MSNAEEKTRKWQQSPADEQAAAPPQIISFYCPNGHRIKVEARLAGKSGPCSKCGVVVTIPEVGSAPRRPPGGVKVGETATAGEAPAGFDFLGAAPAEAAAEPAAGLPLVEPAPASEPELPNLVVDAPPADAEAVAEEFPAPVADSIEPPPWEGSTHPTADLVARLWAEREHGGIIEVHHTGGVFVPQWFEFAWSRGTHGLFASQAADGTITLTAVAWDTIQKIIVRQVEGLPEGFV